MERYTIDLCGEHGIYSNYYLDSQGWFTLIGVAANSFTIAGATATNAVNSGVVTAVFPATGASPAVISINMITVAGGTFNNGTANMTVSSFRMSQYEITGDQYASVMGVADPSNFSAVTNNPVEKVTWYDAVEIGRASCRERV